MVLLACRDGAGIMLLASVEVNRGAIAGISFLAQADSRRGLNRQGAT